jgi:hypothetical protein
MKVIFIDFDGVINTLQDFYDYSTNKIDKKTLEAKKLKRIKILSDVCKKYGAKVVIESAHKDLIDEDTLETEIDWIQEIFDILKTNGIEVVGRTPCLEDFKEDYDGNPPIWKEDEILEYLRRHPEIDSYCVIDDDDLVTIPARKEGDFSKSDLNKVRDHLVTIYPIGDNKLFDVGLQEYHKEEIGKILEKKINKSF